ncbi:hypothetical protein F5Y02DRAFT_384249, partial [Annulohypoxylon stygium]
MRVFDAVGGRVALLVVGPRTQCAAAVDGVLVAHLGAGRAGHGFQVVAGEHTSQDWGREAGRGQEEVVKTRHVGFYGYPMSSAMCILDDWLGRKRSCIGDTR